MTHERTHDPKFKTGAKGNFVSFMMPMEKLAHELSKHQSTKRDNPTTLPRTGQDLCDAVVVTLKCLDNELDTKALTQCTVRRNVVIELIRTMVETYQHPAYANVDMGDVVEKAKTQLTPRPATTRPSSREKYAATAPN